MQRLTHEQIEAYLDGALPPEDVAGVESALRQDRAAAGMLEQARDQRALRAAALASYAPGDEESAAAARRCIAALQDEGAAVVGSIGTWLRRAAAVAAVVAISAGSFWTGRATSPREIARVEVPTDRYIVVVKQGDDVLVTREFASRDEAQNFAVDFAEQTGDSSMVAGIF